MVRISWVKRVAYLYLLFPIIVFGLGWLNPFAATLFILIVTISLFFVWKTEEAAEVVSVRRRDWIFTFFVLLVWVFLSGIGGYSFQNWDHHSRNAVFRDLINYSWPVVYHVDSDIASQFTSSPDVILSYYFGFWLPAALIGKLAGWSAANFFLFLWAFLGVALAMFLTSFRIGLSLLKTALLIIFFSGMDIVGTWLLQMVPGYSYPGIWPPIQHLEWWAGSLQYPSFTTGLFWTYNQFIPTLLVLSLFVTVQNNRSVLFLAGICFFFAPLPALGLLPFIAGKVVEEIVSVRQNEQMSVLSYLLKYLLTPENLGGVFIGIFSLIFYSTNLSAQSKAIGLTAPLTLYIMFLFLEGLLLWLILLPMHRRDWSWYLTGFILVIVPFVRLGDSWDFMMRTTLPALYLLLIGCGVLFVPPTRFRMTTVLTLLLLVLGALTPISELSRSVIRLNRYYDQILPSSIFEGYFQNPPRTSQLFVPEMDHLNTLIADDWVSVSIPNSMGWNTKVGNLFPSAFALLWDKDLIQK